MWWWKDVERGRLVEEAKTSTEDMKIKMAEHCERERSKERKF
jgi:hypothetical protein